MVRRASLLLSLAVFGCAGVHPAALNPLRTRADFQSRSLSDPALRHYVESHAGSPLPSWPPTTWGPRTLTLVAYYYHPDLDVARARAEAAGAGVRTAKQRPNPTLGFPLQYNASVSPAPSPWTLGLNLDVPIEIAGKRGYRAGVARNLSDAARIDLAQAGWKVRVQVRTALLDYLITTAELDSLQAEVDGRTRLVGLLEKRLQIGEAAGPEVYTSRAALNASRAALAALSGRAGGTRISVAQALGVPPSALDGTLLEWPRFDSVPEDSSLSPLAVQAAGLLNRLDVQRSLAEYGAAVAALQLEGAKRYPDLHLGPGFSWDQGARKYALGFSFELPLFNRNEGPIAEAEARLKEARARFIATQAQAISETARAWATLRAARASLSSADSALAAEAQRFRSAEHSLALGNLDRVELSGARVNLAAAGRARLESLRAARTALVELESAVQRPLEPGEDGSAPDLSEPRRSESEEKK